MSLTFHSGDSLGPVVQNGWNVKRLFDAQNREGKFQNMQDVDLPLPTSLKQKRETYRVENLSYVKQTYCMNGRL